MEAGEIPAPDANLIMLSVTLPDGNGIEMCRDITDEISPFLPVTLIADLDTVDARIHAARAGADEGAVYVVDS